MKNQSETETNSFNVDLDQWRRDIDTFASATTSALDAIVNELSNACSGGEIRPIASTASRIPIAKQSKVNTTTSRQNTTSKTNNTPSSTGSNSRLASLKEKLASRMNKN